MDMSRNRHHLKLTLIGAVTTWAVVLLFGFNMNAFWFLMWQVAWVSTHSAVLMMTLRKGFGTLIASIAVFAILLYGALMYTRSNGLTQTYRRGWDARKAGKLAELASEFAKAHGRFPVSLDELALEQKTEFEAFSSPRGRGNYDIWDEGYMHFLVRNRIPAPLREEVKGRPAANSDYVYLSENANNGERDAIIVTKPGLLSGNFTSVAFKNGHAETMSIELALKVPGVGMEERE